MGYPYIHNYGPICVRSAYTYVTTMVICDLIVVVLDDKKNIFFHVYHSKI